jgi:hypothetical protein
VYVIETPSGDFFLIHPEEKHAQNGQMNLHWPGEPGSSTSAHSKVVMVGLRRIISFRG